MAVRSPAKRFAAGQRASAVRFRTAIDGERTDASAMASAAMRDGPDFPDGTSGALIERGGQRDSAMVAWPVAASAAGTSPKPEQEANRVSTRAGRESLAREELKGSQFFNDTTKEDSP
ncbi:MAG TPA: hypothetical protein DGC76_06920 [Candidatus Accumulibacter sp.]|nr:hypothetical protein [Accumulibacter sp.]HCV13414.1 hypothetical protein [Accumulibacter sp.]